MKEESDQESILRSYYRILAVFASDKQTTPEQLKSIYIWGKHLAMPSEALDEVVRNPDALANCTPKDAQSSVEQLYNLVYLIYLDKVVEEQEIEILMKYAERLGFPQHIVGDIIKAILTAPADGISIEQVRGELRDLLEASLG